MTITITIHVRCRGKARIVLDFKILLTHYIFLIIILFIYLFGEGRCNFLQRALGIILEIRKKKI